MNEKYSVQVDEDMKTVLETLEDTSRQYLDESSQMLATLALNFYARNQVVTLFSQLSTIRC